jgi:hypothetical protein
MNRNGEEGWENPAANDPHPAFELSENARNIMMILFVFSLIFFFIQYKNVYGTPTDPNDF